MSKRFTARNVATLAYPESLSKEDMLKYLEELHCIYYVSPLHDSDVKDKETGEIKKAHYHIVLHFGYSVDFENTKDKLKKLGFVGCEKVLDKKAYIRYLIHIDNPEKYQYKQEDIITNDQLIDDYFSAGISDKQVIDLIFKFKAECKEKGIRDIRFIDFVYYCYSKHGAYLKFIRKNTFFIKQFF